MERKETFRPTEPEVEVDADEGVEDAEIDAAAYAEMDDVAAADTDAVDDAILVARSVTQIVTTLFESLTRFPVILSGLRRVGTSHSDWAASLAHSHFDWFSSAALVAAAVSGPQSEMPGSIGTVAEDDTASFTQFEMIVCLDAAVSACQEAAMEVGKVTEVLCPRFKEPDWLREASSTFSSISSSKTSDQQMLSQLPLTVGSKKSSGKQKV